MEKPGVSLIQCQGCVAQRLHQGEVLLRKPYQSEGVENLRLLHAIPANLLQLLLRDRQAPPPPPKRPPPSLLISPNPTISRAPVQSKTPAPSPQVCSKHRERGAGACTHPQAPAAPTWKKYFQLSSSTPRRAPDLPPTAPEQWLSLP